MRSSSSLFWVFAVAGMSACGKTGDAPALIASAAQGESKPGVAPTERPEPPKPNAARTAPEPAAPIAVEAKPTGEDGLLGGPGHFWADVSNKPGWKVLEAEGDLVAYTLASPAGRCEFASLLATDALVCTVAGTTVVMFDEGTENPRFAVAVDGKLASDKAAQPKQADLTGDGKSDVAFVAVTGATSTVVVITADGGARKLHVLPSQPASASVHGFDVKAASDGPDPITGQVLVHPSKSGDPCTYVWSREAKAFETGWTGSIPGCGETE